MNHMNSFLSISLPNHKTALKDAEKKHQGEEHLVDRLETTPEEEQFENVLPEEEVKNVLSLQVDFEDITTTTEGPELEELILEAPTVGDETPVERPETYLSNVVALAEAVTQSSSILDTFFLHIKARLHMTHLCV